MEHGFDQAGRPPGKADQRAQQQERGRSRQGEDLGLLQLW